MAIENPNAHIWMNGEMVPWNEAKIHVSVHALHYGTSVFEGARCYNTVDGPAVFRLQDHTRRLFNSAKIARMPITRYSEAQINQATLDTIAKNGYDSCYIRPVAFKNTPMLGLAADGEVDVAILTWEWGAYLGEEGLTQGIDAVVTSWRRPAHGTLTPLGKIGGQYVGNIYSSLEARRHGYVEAIVLDMNGYVGEGAGENLFCVSEGILYTPPLATSMLAGITRDTVIKLAQDLEIPLRESNLTREMLYIADEVFMTGTAAEITPVRSLDQVQIGSGTRGPITKQLQDAFFALVRGEAPDTHGWLTHVQRQKSLSAGD